MDPIIGAGIIGGVSSLVGSGLNVIGASSTNRSSKEIAHMNNKAMINMMREQTRLEQDYNSIGSQMKRAIAAGVNPMLLAGAQPTSASSSAVPNLDSPNLQNPFNAVDLGGSSIANAMIQSKSLANQEKALDIQDFESTIQLFDSISRLAQSGSLSSDNINDLINKFIRPDKRSALGPLVYDDYLKTKMANAIEISKLDLEEKKYAYSWLDEWTNAQFTNLLADTEFKQTSSVRNRSQIEVDNSIKAMNEAKKNELEQALKNMQEQWKSLNFQGEVDSKKLLHVMKIADDIVRKYHYEAGVSELDFRNYIFNKYLNSSGQFGGLFGTMSGTFNDVSHPNQNY